MGRASNHVGQDWTSPRKLGWVSNHVDQHSTSPRKLGRVQPSQKKKPGLLGCWLAQPDPADFGLVDNIKDKMSLFHPL
jgi:hypothetical protein